MEREPDYEDERVRFWKRPRNEPLPTIEDDPTVLKFDLATEEIYESRVYNVRPEAWAETAADVLEAHPEVPPGELLILLKAAEESTFRILAKRDRGDGLLSWILISIFAGERELIAQRDRESEPVFRQFVTEFEADALDGGVVEEPAVMTIDEWRIFEQQQSLQRP